MAEPEGLTGGTPRPGQDPAPGAVPEPAAGSVAERLARLPANWELGWWLLMRPISLRRRLRGLGIEPDADAWRLWQGDAVARAYLARMALSRLVGTSVAAVVIGFVLVMVGLDANWMLVAFGAAISVAYSGAARRVARGTAGAMSGAMIGGLAFGVALLRLPLYLLELPWQLIAFTMQRSTGRITLAASPVLHDELIYLPLPTLEEHICNTAARDPALVLRALAACAIAPGQRRAGRRALALLRADELATLARTRRFQSLRDLHGEWLPDPASADGTFAALQQVGRYLRAAELTLIARQRQELLTAAADRLRGLDNALLGSRDLEAPIYRAALPNWQRLVADWLAETKTAAALEVPNPFRPLVPLEPEFGREVFRGREPLVAEIESILGDPGQGRRSP